MEDQDELQYIDKIVEILRVAKAAIPSAFVSSPLDDPAGIDYFYSILARGATHTSLRDLYFVVNP